MANGLGVDLLAEPCGDTAVVALGFDVGTDHDPAERSGLALLVARLLSTSEKTPNHSVVAGTDYLFDTFTVPPGQLVAALDGVAAHMAGRDFSEEQVERARKEVLEDVARREGGDPELTATTYAAESLLPSPGNGRRGGLAKEVQAITPEEVAAFVRDYLTPPNARLAVLGGFDVAAVKKQIESRFAALPAGKPPTARERSGATVHGTLVMGDAPSTVAIAVPSPDLSAPTFPAFLVLAARLANVPGAGFGVRYDPLAQPEVLFVTSQLPAGQAAEPAAAKVWEAVLAALVLPLQTDELAKTRQKFAFLLEEDLKSCGKDPRAFAFARARRAQLKLVAAQLSENLNKVTDEELREASKLFGPARATAVISGGAIR